MTRGPTTDSQGEAPAGAGIAFAALIAGAVGMGASPIFVRLADVGPMASAFWRVALALPPLWIWAHLERAERDAEAAPQTGLIVLAGAFFAGDLIFWHLSIVKTTVANATFFATMAPLAVLVFSWLVIKEPVRRHHLVGLGFCLAGGSLLVGSSLRLAPERLEGDLYGLATAFFFASYIIAVGRLRSGGFGTGRVMFASTLATAAILLPVALLTEDVFWPSSLAGIAAVVALGLVAHVGGQGLLGFALGRLPASFSSLVIFLEGVAAAGLGWIVLGERLSTLQGLGALVIIAGVVIARGRARRGGIP